MIDINKLDQQCPKCSGLGRTENPAWMQFWTKDWFRTLDNNPHRISLNTGCEESQPLEPMFFICKECHGRGKILTEEGKRLIEFVKFWTNPNY